MTGEITASAPGKLVLAGEYAVLDGVPAISAAVNKRATAIVTPVSVGELLIVNTGLRYAYKLDAHGQPNWLSDPGDSGGLFAAVLKTLAQRHTLPANQQPWKLSLCSREFYADLPDGSMCKLGTGSSAAVSVALTAALQSSVGRKPDLALCLAAHRDFQQGGSGIDVATSWYGGVVLMQPGAHGEPVIETLNWPRGFHMRPVWTGIAAATPAMLQRLDAYRHRYAQEYAKLLQQFKTAMEAIQRNWSCGAIVALTEGLTHYAQLLEALDAAANIGIWSDRHHKLRAVATSMGVGYKPSGAGGGDFGLAFSQDAAAVDAYVHAVHARLVPQTHGVEWTSEGLLLNGESVKQRQ